MLQNTYINNDKQWLPSTFYRQHPYMDYTTPFPFLQENLVSPLYDLSKILNLPLNKGGFHTMYWVNLNFSTALQIIFII